MYFFRQPLFSRLASPVIACVFRQNVSQFEFSGEKREEAFFLAWHLTLHLSDPDILLSGDRKLDHIPHKLRHFDQGNERASDEKPEIAANACDEGEGGGGNELSLDFCCGPVLEANVEECEMPCHCFCMKVTVLIASAV